MKERLLQYYQIFCDLSLDVVLGVISCMLPLPGFFGIDPGTDWYIGLPVATWIIYLSDHLNDLRINPHIHTHRHDFIRTNKHKISLLILVLCVVLVYLTMSLYNPSLFLSGVIVGILCFVYFLLTSLRQESWQWLFNKELMVGLIYATGIYIYFGLRTHNLMLTWLFPYLTFASLAYQNLLMVSIAEMQDDANNLQFSWTSVLGKKQSGIFFLFLNSVTTLLTGGYLCFIADGFSSLFTGYLLIGLINLILYGAQNKGGDTGSIRKTGEMAFWIPGLVYLAGKILY